LLPERRKRLLRFAGWTLAIIIIARVGASLFDGLRQLAAQPLAVHPRWGMIALSGAVFLCAHSVLVLTWSAVLSCWDQRLPFWTAARIWSVSNLGRYLPGKVWQIGAMGAMARQVSVSPIAASGSAILGTLVNILAGFAVATASGSALLERAGEGQANIAIAISAISRAMLLLAPWLVPRFAPLIARVTGRTVTATLPVRAVVYSLIGNTVAWLVYGAAFQLFVLGVLGANAGGYSAYLATYTISYVIGYIVLFAPAGIGVREGAMLQLLQLARLASLPQATLVTIGSRVWLTILEVMPALLFWMYHAVRLRSQPLGPTDATT